MPTRYWLVGPARCWPVSRLEAAGGVQQAEAEVDPAGDRRRPPLATPPSATPPSPQHATARAPPAASAARARASSACTPTTPGSWPAATTRSGGGSPASLAARLDVEVGPTSTSSQPRRARPPHPRRDRARSCATDLVDPDPRSPAQLTNAIGRRHGSRRRRAARRARARVDAHRRPRPRRRDVAPGRRSSSGTTLRQAPQRGHRPRRGGGGLPGAGHGVARQPAAQPAASTRRGSTPCWPRAACSSG